MSLLLKNFKASVLIEQLLYVIIFMLPRLYGADHVRAILLRVAGASLKRNVKIKRGFSSAPYGELSNLHIGNNTFINVNFRVAIAAEVRIGSNCSIGPNVSIETVNHPVCNETNRRLTEYSGVKIGDEVWIGAGAIILPGVVIGDGVTVAAGAVVVNDVKSGCVVAGVPAKIINE